MSMWPQYSDGKWKMRLLEFLNSPTLFSSLLATTIRMLASTIRILATTIRIWLELATTNMAWFPKVYPS